MPFGSLIVLLNLQEIFPTTSSVVIFITYMIVCLQQALLVTASRMGERTYPYNPAAVVLSTELLKLVFSSIAYIKRYVFNELVLY